MISHQKNFLFVHIPKTGGNSIQTLLKEHSEDVVTCHTPNQDGIERFGITNPDYNLRKHSPLSEYHAALPREMFNRLFKFATIRNPWDMMVSFYFSPNLGNNEWDREKFLLMLQDTPTLRYYIEVPSLFQKTMAKIGVRCAPGNKPLDRFLDALMRFEHLEEDFKSVCEKIEIPHTPLPVRNKSEREHYSVYYDQELIDLVQQKFSEEIKLGRYQFETK